MKGSATQMTSGSNKNCHARVASGLREQIKALMVTSAVAVLFTVLLLTTVTRDELLQSDEFSCIGARPNRCNRSMPWKWGRTESFGVIWSYRLLSSGLLALQFFCYTLFFCLALYMSLCIGMNHGDYVYEKLPATLTLYYWIHDFCTFLSVATFFVGLVYFLFGVQAMIHVKYPSYKPKRFWDEETETITETYNNPPYSYFTEVIVWLTSFFSLGLFLIFALLAKVPQMAGGDDSSTSQEYPQEQTPPDENPSPHQIDPSKIDYPEESA